MKIIFATHNNNKIKEVQSQLKSNITVVGLKDIGILHEIPEDGLTLKENAIFKADFLYKTHGGCCFSDDTGLEVEALNNAPGVYSARYAGPDKDSKKNVKKLLSDMKYTVSRKARFKTVLALIIKGKQYIFEGIVNGEITYKPLGSGGFGYDAIFLPEHSERTFAQMSLQEKTAISHRGKALSQLIKFLSSYQDTLG